MSSELPPVITLEEHFLSASAPQELLVRYNTQLGHIPRLVESLQDVGQLRLEGMDSGAVTVQVISHTPGLSTASLESCVRANDQLHKDTQDHKRFAGFAVLPMLDPAAAAKELHRSVKDLGFVGALVDNHAQGVFYEGPAYDVFWSAAEDLDVPIYLHPTWPEEAMMKARYEGDSLNKGATFSIASAGWGWHVDTAVHFLRLFAAGVFDRHPRLKLIIGHMGEMLPFQLQRVINSTKSWGKFERGLKQVWDENLWITTSGNWSLDPMACLLRNTKKERVLYSVDYPFASSSAGRQFLIDLKNSGMVSPAEMEMICHKNAEELLKIKAV